MDLQILISDRKSQILAHRRIANTSVQFLSLKSATVATAEKQNFDYF